MVGEPVDEYDVGAERDSEAARYQATGKTLVRVAVEQKLRMIRTCSHPNLDAPEWVRVAWAGLLIPINQTHYKGGYLYPVDSVVAINLLAEKNRDAAIWMRTNFDFVSNSILWFGFSSCRAFEYFE